MTIGIFEIGLACMMFQYMNIDFSLIEEGIEDIMYAINCIFGKESFDWKDVGKRKIAFTIKLLVNVATYYIRGGLNLPDYGKKGKSLKQIFGLIGNNVKGKLMKEGVKLGIKYFGDNLLVTIVKKMKGYCKYLCVEFYENKIKKYILGIFGKDLETMMTIEVISGKNDWTRILTQEIKVGCRALIKLQKEIIKILKTIINLLMNR